MIPPDEAPPKTGRSLDTRLGLDCPVRGRNTRMMYSPGLPIGRDIR